MARINRTVSKTTPKTAPKPVPEKDEDEKEVILNLEDQDAPEDDVVDADDDSADADDEGEEGAQGDDSAGDDEKSSEALRGDESGGSAPAARKNDAVVVHELADAQEYIVDGVWTEAVHHEFIPWGSKRSVTTIVGIRGQRA